MAKYKPPEQEKALQFVDVGFLIVAIFGALWLPLKLGLAGALRRVPADTIAAARARTRR